MIRRILIVLAIFIGVSLIALWFLTGGVGRVQRASNAMSNPLAILFGGESPGLLQFSLPWQPKDLTLGADLSEYSSYTGASDEPYSTDSARDAYQDTQSNVMEIQGEIDAIRESIADSRTFGDPSPYRGMVRIADRMSPVQGSAEDEYLKLEASHSNTAPVDVSGWSIQSVASGKILLLPRAARLFVAGAVNAAGTVLLDPGASALVNTGLSPTGVSFRENVCSGYLSQFQRFAPDIERTCPSPADALPMTPENLKTFRSSCFSYVNSIPPCSFPLGKTPSSVSVQCADFARDTFSYNGCVQRYQFRADFLRPQWRLFLNAPRPQWGFEHDIIRLLDKQGRTVDVLKY